MMKLDTLRPSGTNSPRSAFDFIVLVLDLLCRSLERAQIVAAFMLFSVALFTFCSPLIIFCATAVTSWTVVLVYLLVPLLRILLVFPTTKWWALSFPDARVPIPTSPGGCWSIYMRNPDASPDRLANSGSPPPLPVPSLPRIRTGWVRLCFSVSPAMLMVTLLRSMFFPLLTLLAVRSRLQSWVMNTPAFTFVSMGVPGTLVLFAAVLSCVVGVAASLMLFPSPTSRLTSLPPLIPRLGRISFFFFFALPAIAARFPLDQLDPPTYTNLIKVDDPFLFVNRIKYCHNYPDFMCYVRTGNGWTAGDEMAWTVTSCADSSGLGAVRITFPAAIDRQSNDETNGLFHESNRGKVSGSHVVLTAFNGFIRFHPGATIDFYAFVPFERWPGSLYVDFSAPPNECYAFAFRRSVIWSGSAPPYVPPENDPHHDEL